MPQNPTRGIRPVDSRTVCPVEDTAHDCISIPHSSTAIIKEIDDLAKDRSRNPPLTTHVNLSDRRYAHLPKAPPTLVVKRKFIDLYISRLGTSGDLGPRAGGNFQRANCTSILCPSRDRVGYCVSLEVKRAAHRPGDLAGDNPEWQRPANHSTPNDDRDSVERYITWAQDRSPYFASISSWFPASSPHLRRKRFADSMVHYVPDSTEKLWILSSGNRLMLVRETFSLLEPGWNSGCSRG